MEPDARLRHEIEMYMRRKGVSRVELARRLDMSPQYLSDVLTGRRGRLPKSLSRILKALDLEIEVTSDVEYERSPIPAEVERLLDKGLPPKVIPGHGKPRGGRVRLKGGASVADAVVEERDERSREL